MLLNDKEIEQANREASREVWSHKPHPRFEREKVLLKAQLKKIVREFEGYICKGCSTRNFVNIVVPLKNWQELKREIE